MLSDVSSLPLSVLMRPLKLKKGGQAQAWSADLRDEPRDAYWMLNGSAWPNGASACSLSSVLETGPIPEKYYLSARACSGILRRAEKRGKQLPKALREALEAVANGRQTLAPPLNASWADRSAGSQAQEWDSEKGGRFVPDVGFALNAKGGGGRIDGESETFVAHTTGAGYWQEGAGTLRAREQESHEHLVAHSLRADGFDASEDGTGRGTPIVPMGFRACGQDGFTPADVAPPIISTDGGGAGVPSVLTFHYVGVRRLTPIECERLQGFPDGWTAIPFCGKPAADGPRYKALGNSMAVPVMRWIGQRIANQPW